MNTFYKNSLFLAPLELLLLCLMNYFGDSYLPTTLNSSRSNMYYAVFFKDFRSVNDQWTLLKNSCSEF